MKFTFLHSIAFLLLSTFTSQQILQAHPIQSGSPVIASIEDRHFVLVTQIEGADCAVIPAEAGIQDCRVHFLENGYIRVKAAGEFQARWFGIGLADESALSSAGLLNPTKALKIFLIFFQSQEKKPAPLTLRSSEVFRCFALLSMTGEF